MVYSIVVYDNVNGVKNFFRYKIYNDVIGKKNQNNNNNIYHFNTQKYSNKINIQSDLGTWIKHELKIIDAVGGQLFVLDDYDKVLQLRDKIWNNEFDNEFNNESISNEFNSLTFAYEAFHWIKEGNQLYFYITQT